MICHRFIWAAKYFSKEKNVYGHKNCQDNSIKVVQTKALKCLYGINNKT